VKIPTRKEEKMSDKDLGLNKSLELYFEDLDKLPPLDRKTEQSLAERIKENDQEALDELVKKNLRFVVSVAKQYVNQGLSLEDLISQGNVGLIKAAKRFDGNRGFRFISYAVWWIRQTILQALAEQSRIIRIPLNRANTLYQVGKISRELAQQLEREPENTEIAEKLEITLEEVEEAKQILKKPILLTQPTCNNDDESDLIESFYSEGRSIDEKIIDDSCAGDIKKALENLTEREREIIVLYFGLNGKEPLTLKEIGRKMNLTRERIRQIKEKSIKKLSKLEAFKEKK